MVRLYFNLAALLQVIIICVLYFGYGVLDEYLLHWTNRTNGTKDPVVSLQIAALVCVFTELKGLKGRLFFMPVWLVCIIVSLFLSGTVYFEGAWVLPLLQLSSLLITIYFFWKIPLRIRKVWQQK